MSLPVVFQSYARCRIARNDGRPCSNEAHELFGGIDVCWVHLRSLERAAEQQLYDVGFRAEIRRDLDLIDHERRELARLARDARQAKLDAAAVVYYGRRDGFIKIGYTTDLTKRMTSLSRGGTKAPEGMTVGPIELLAIHGGGQNAERVMHRRFAADRVIGEWFHPSERLLDHIAHVARRQSRRSLETR